MTIASVVCNGMCQVPGARFRVEQFLTRNLEPGTWNVLWWKIAETLQGLVVPLPVGPNLDPELQEDLRTEEHLNLRPGLLPDLLQHRPAPPDDDPLLRVPFDIDGRLDVGELSPFPRFYLLHLDGHRIRHLLVSQMKDLLSDQLGDNEPLRLVSQLIERIEGLPLWQVSDQQRLEDLNVVPFGCGDRNDLDK